jgi:uncharacterized membrane protein YbhN (UPF0104 family)
MCCAATSAPIDPPGGGPEPDLRTGFARLILRLAVAFALLGLAIWLVGFARLRQQLLQVNQAWLAAAVLSAALAQWMSIYRWETIARIFGLHVQTRALAIAYAQGMTLNVLLPGATLGGDALRSVRLQSLGNPLGVSALTVLLDRLSGLWVLCVLSLLTALGMAIAAVLRVGPAASALAGDASLPLALPGIAQALGTRGVLAAYIAGLGLLCAIPWLPLRPRASSQPGETGLVRRLWCRLCQLHDLAIAERRPLGRSLWSSVLVQLLCAVTLWLCAVAAGGPVGYWQVQVVAAPVFIAGALPLSYGGFGARELMALVAFPLAGMSSDLGLAASALYGIVAVILGLLAVPSFALGGHLIAARGRDQSDRGA